MTWQTWTLAILIVVFAAMQYSLAWSAMVDLLHRPRVRGNSHMAWALVIMCIPVVGAIVYGAVGPTSFRATQILRSTFDEQVQQPMAHSTEKPANVTPFRKSSGGISDLRPAHRPGVTRSRAHNTHGPVSRLRRPGA